MNQKIRKLQNQILTREKQRENLVKHQKKALDEFDMETKKIENRLVQSLQSENPQIKATNAWCNITNALIRKYKQMTEEDPVKALRELTKIEGALLAGGFLTQEELEA